MMNCIGLKESLEDVPRFLRYNLNWNIFFMDIFMIPCIFPMAIIDFGQPCIIINMNIIKIEFIIMSVYGIFGQIAAYLIFLWFASLIALCCEACSDDNEEYGFCNSFGMLNFIFTIICTMFPLLLSVVSFFGTLVSKIDSVIFISNAIIHILIHIVTSIGNQVVPT